jgi:hypothetical protein
LAGLFELRNNYKRVVVLIVRRRQINTTSKYKQGERQFQIFQLARGRMNARQPYFPFRHKKTDILYLRVKLSQKNLAVFLIYDDFRFNRKSSEKCVYLIIEYKRVYLRV